MKPSETVYVVITEQGTGELLVIDTDIIISINCTKLQPPPLTGKYVEEIIHDKPREEQMLNCKFSKYFIICPQIFPSPTLENKY